MVLARPDGVAATEIDLWDDGVGSTADGEEGRTGPELERPRGPDPRVRQVSSADYSDSRVEVALATTTGIRRPGPAHERFLSVDAIAGEGADTQTGTGFSVGRGPGELDPDEAMDDAVERATRMLGRHQGPFGALHRGLRPTSGVHPALGGRPGALRRGRRQRPLFLRRTDRRDRRRRGVTLVDDPTDPRAYGAASHDGEGLACRRNVLIADGVLRMFVFDTVSARRAGTVSTGSAVRGGFAGTPSPGCRALVLAPGARGSTRSWPRSATASTCSRSRACTRG